MTALKQAALSRFSIPMLFSAKKSLWEFCEADLSLLDVPFTPRRSSEKRTQAAADLEDILLAFSKLDEADKVPQIFCEATDLVKLPPIAADPISDLVLGNKACLQEIEGKISRLHAQITALQESTVKVEANISTAPSPQLSYADAVRAVSSSVAGGSGQSVSGLKSADKRAGNLIVFGLPEVESLPDLKKSVDELLNFLVGRSVPLNDLFCLGRRKKTSDSEVQCRPRPVMLQPLSSWDRRLVLSAVRKLKGYTVSNVYIREDLSPVERQKRRERFGTRKVAAAVVGSDHTDSHCPPQSQSLPITSHPSPSVIESSSSAQGSLTDQ